MGIFIGILDPQVIETSGLPRRNSARDYRLRFLDFWIPEPSTEQQPQHIFFLDTVRKQRVAKSESETSIAGCLGPRCHQPPALWPTWIHTLMFEQALINYAS